jgi:hypothetical protein
VRFRSLRALRNLFERGITVTIRVRKYRVGDIVPIYYCHGDECHYVGRGIIEGVYELREAERLYSISGFSSPEEWLETARRLHSWSLNRAKIYVVKLIRSKQRHKKSISIDEIKIKPELEK